jgi:hypothetical protein
LQKNSGSENFIFNLGSSVFKMDRFRNQAEKWHASVSEVSFPLKLMYRTISSVTNVNIWKQEL